MLIANAYVHIFGFCLAQQGHTQASTKNTLTHASKSSSPVLLSVLKVRFAGEISPALLSIPISIMLVFHKIIKARIVVFKSCVNVHLKSLLRGPRESLLQRVLSSILSVSKTSQKMLRGF